MTLICLQIAAIGAAAVYLGFWRTSVRRRNARSWESLLGRLRPEWSARELIGPSFSNEGSQITRVEKWKRIRGARGLWGMFENAGVMVEMADYAARNSDSIDRELLDTLRRDAMRIRVYVLTMLAKYAFSDVSEWIVISALRVESAYAEMVIQMAEFLQENATEILPKFENAI